ncbi:hypothetical protein MKX01_006934 [Papaver californicum]|nr:hypothetical protein MKX01_006934 [Papaver californicum]
MDKFRVSVLLCFALVFLGSWIGFAEAGRRAHLLQQKPDPKDAVATARWLVSQNNWGVLSTISLGTNGWNVVSFSDGLPDKGHGIPYFYLITLDSTARNGMKDARSSFTVSEFPIGTCGKKDPENPTCAKLTLTGKILDINSKEASIVKDALFAKHPEMKGFIYHLVNLFMNLFKILEASFIIW